MNNLPELAQALDADASSGLFGGSVDATGTAWSVYMDFDEGENELALAAQPLAPYVQPMALDGITVADDPEYLPRLLAARNLPEFVKLGLPPLYGEELPLPAGATFLREAAPQLAPQVLETAGDLKTFLRTWGELSLAERKIIVEQALVLLEQNYVHLPFKRAMHAVDPVQRLRLLRHRLDEAQEGGMPIEIEFHNELVRIFNSLHDLHTSYRLPTPFRGKAAWLPFTVEEFWEHGHRRYLVSKVVGKPGPDSFQPGVEVLYWNGMPIDRAVTQNAERQAGSNEAARHAQGLNSLTIRPLAQGLPPDEEWVTLQYRDQTGQIHEWSQEWLIFEPGRGVNSVNPESSVSAATALGLDPNTDDVQEAKRVLYAGNVVIEETRAAEDRERVAIQNTRDGVATFMPTVFRAKPVTTEHGTFGYVRIFTFNVDDAGGFVREFVRLTKALPQNGLIVDVRGNGGGLIHAAERLLQVLTPRQIEPERAQFVNSPVNLQICRSHAPSSQFPDFDLAPWIESIERSVETGAAYSLSFPITEPQSCNDIGQEYYGPILLITDALCYSATDIFAAGFQDHKVGAILGISENTGAGGANVWSHYILRTLMEAPSGASGIPSPYVPLPHGADLRVAVRRTVRVGSKAGDVVEDLGITPDHVHRMTRRDLLEGNHDLIDEATRLLALQKPHSMQVEVEPREGGLPLVQVETQHVTRLDVWLNGRPQRSLDVRGDVTVIDLNDIAAETAAALLHLELRAFEDDQLVMAYREALMA
jgi:C-terminal processing protease CtpA/Prc